MADRNGNIIRLLVANERLEVAESIGRYLNDFPQVSVIGTTHTLDDTLGCARELRPSAVLCDYQRFKPETLERIRRLRQELPEVCIIAMSYDAQQTDEVIQAGANQFIPKFELSGCLLDALEQCTAPLS